MMIRRCAWCRHRGQHRQWSSWGWLCRSCITEIARPAPNKDVTR